MRWRAPAAFSASSAAAGAPAAMMRGTAAIALTLFDHDTPVWLDPLMSETSDVAKWLKFHTGAPVIADSSICSFALIGDARALPGARPLCVRQQRVSGSLDDADPAGRKPDAGVRLRIARSRHRRHRRLAGHDPAGGSVRAACHQRRAVSARHRCRAGGRRCRLSRYRAPRGWSRRETEACMSPSREANAPSRTPIGCWRMSAAAIATFRKSRSPRSPNSSASASIAS